MLRDAFKSLLGFFVIFHDAIFYELDVLKPGVAGSLLRPRDLNEEAGLGRFKTVASVSALAL